jgi:hypothetical protein
MRYEAGLSWANPVRLRPEGAVANNGRQDEEIGRRHDIGTKTDFVRENV